MAYGTSYRNKKYTWTPEPRHCCYCQTIFLAKRADARSCSPVCSKRLAEWDRWIATTRREAMFGARQTPLPFGKAAQAAIAPFQELCNV